MKNLKENIIWILLILMPVLLIVAVFTSLPVFGSIFVADFLFLIGYCIFVYDKPIKREL